MLHFTRHHPLIAFFALAFAIAWAILIPSVLASYGLIRLPGSTILLLVMGYGPTIAALLVSGVLGGWTEIRGLLQRLLIWRVGWGWWAVTLFLNGAIILGALGLYAVLGNELPPFPALGPGLVLDIVITFVLVALINGEEIGWRGFALPRLQVRYGVPTSVAVLGVLETLFHLPIFFNNGPSEAGGQNGTPFGAFLASSVLAVFLFVWLYDHTHASLLIATLFHASMNAWSNILPFPATSAAFFWLLAVAQLAAVAVVLVAGGTRWLQSGPAATEHSGLSQSRPETGAQGGGQQPRDGVRAAVDAEGQHLEQAIQPRRAHGPPGNGAAAELERGQVGDRRDAHPRA